MIGIASFAFSANIFYYYCLSIIILRMIWSNTLLVFIPSAFAYWPLPKILVRLSDQRFLRDRVYRQNRTMYPYLDQIVHGLK